MIVSGDGEEEEGHVFRNRLFQSFFWNFWFEVEDDDRRDFSYSKKKKRLLENRRREESDNRFREKI